MPERDYKDILLTSQWNALKGMLDLLGEDGFMPRGNPADCMRWQEAVEYARKVAKVWTLEDIARFKKEWGGK